MNNGSIIGGQQGQDSLNRLCNEERCCNIKTNKKKEIIPPFYSTWVRVSHSMPFGKAKLYRFLWGAENDLKIEV